jgi:DNA-directed RNA polymerase subunit RPC12/RpoP
MLMWRAEGWDEGRALRSRANETEQGMSATDSLAGGVARCAAAHVEEGLSMENFDFDDDSKGKKGKRDGKAHKEWDCPTCYANNPTDEPINDKDELRCNYCGNEVRVSFTESGKLRFKEL